MKLSIMQPYFFPYIGYFQLLRAVDEFVVYDNIKYTKRGWINRNRFLRQGHAADFTLPLRKASDSLDVRQREIAQEFDRRKLLNQIREAYRKAPYFEDAFALFESAVLNPDVNLFRFIHFSLQEACRYMNIQTKLVVSSDVDIDPSLKAQNKVIAICKKLGADTYVNPSGGRELYSRSDFNSAGIELLFLNSKASAYRQLENEFVPSLSIIDVMMFNSPAALEKMLTEFELIEPALPMCLNGVN